MISIFVFFGWEHISFQHTIWDMSQGYGYAAASLTAGSTARQRMVGGACVRLGIDDLSIGFILFMVQFQTNLNEKRMEFKSTNIILCYAAAIHTTLAVTRVNRGSGWASCGTTRYT